MATMAKKEEGLLIKAGTNRVDFVEFYIGNASYGINILKVKQILVYNPEALTRLDNAPSEVMGSIYFRGKPILLIDLAKALDLESDPSANKCVLASEFNSYSTAFLIDGVNRIHRGSWEQFQPMRSIVGTDSSVTGTITVNDVVIQILDLEDLMAKICPNISIQASEPDLIPAEDENSDLPKPDLERRKEIKIIFMEDSSMIRRVTCQKLKEAGFPNIKTFENGLEGMNYFQNLRSSVNTLEDMKQHVNVVITDIEMPQMDGLTFCKELKKDSLFRSLPVIVFSSLPPQQVGDCCKEVGADLHMSKPRVHEIAAAIERMAI